MAQRLTFNRPRRLRLWSALAASLTVLSMALLGQPAQAADGAIIKTITAAGYSCTVGTGIAFDGTNLLLSCNDNGVITAVSPSDGSFVRSYSISNLASIGALAWDRARNRLWACGGFSGDDTIVYTIDLGTQTAATAFTGTSGCPDGLAYDGTDDTLYLSADVATVVQHFKSDGTLIKNIDVSTLLGGCGNSGLAIGGPYLFLANNGCSQIYRADKNDLSTTQLFGDYPARLEDMECDDRTFQAQGKAAIWSKDAYDGILNAFELNPGQCGFGGLPSASGYVALGDSFSAGEGTGDYMPDTDYSDDRCHRTLHAYGPKLRDDKNLGELTFRACSGAVTQDMLVDNHTWGSLEPGQSTNLRETTAVVTFTIGGNDVGFTEILKACIKTSFNGGNYGCKKNKKLSSAVDNRLNALSGTKAAQSPSDTLIVPIETLLKGMHRRSPVAKLIVVGYPALFGTKKSNYFGVKSAPSKYACDVGSGLTQATIDYDDAQWMNGLQKRLNDTLHGAVTNANAEGIDAVFVDPSSTFNEHNFCGSYTNWFYRLRRDGAGTWVGSFHPTDTGQDGYNTAIKTGSGL